MSQVPRVNIRDSILIVITNRILDSANVVNGQGRVLSLRILDLSVEQVQNEVPHERLGKINRVRELANYNLVASVQSNYVYLNYHRPDFYFLHRGCLIFVFLGGDLFMTVDDQYKKQIKRLFKEQGYYVEKANQVLFWLAVKGDEYKFISPQIAPR